MYSSLFVFLSTVALIHLKKQKHLLTTSKTQRAFLCPSARGAPESICKLYTSHWFGCAGHNGRRLWLDALRVSSTHSELWLVGTCSLVPSYTINQWCWCCDNGRYAPSELRVRQRLHAGLTDSRENIRIKTQGGTSWFCPERVSLTPETKLAFPSRPVSCVWGWGASLRYDILEILLAVAASGRLRRIFFMAQRTLKQPRCLLMQLWVNYIPLLDCIAESKPCRTAPNNHSHSVNTLISRPDFTSSVCSFHVFSILW